MFKDTVAKIVIGPRLAATGRLMLWVMLLMVPVALIMGVLAGMREGSRTDRSLSIAAIASTATPEYVSGVILIVLFSSTIVGLSPVLHHWGLISTPYLFKGTATSAMDHITFENFTLPVLTISLYGMGYIARMTRASMAEVMTAQYIRTARLKGVNFRNIVLKHALRNALIAPFTVIMLQIPWLLNGVVITETLFNYKGFGWTLVQAAGEQRHRAAARLFGRRGHRGSGDAADLGHRLCLPQPPHPDFVRSWPCMTHLPGARSSPASSASSCRSGSRWSSPSPVDHLQAPARPLRQAVRQPDRHGRLRAGDVLGVHRALRRR